jgi:hypothetical protein
VLHIKLCEFLQDVKHGQETIWNKGASHTVTYETEDAYYFGFPDITNGIGKEYEGKLYEIIGK